MTHTSIAKNDRLAAVPRRGWRRWVRPLLWLLIFASGFAAGTGVTLIGVRHAALFAIHHPQEMPARVEMSVWPYPQFAARSTIVLSGSFAAPRIVRNSVASNIRLPFAARASRNVFRDGLRKLCPYSTGRSISPWSSPYLKTILTRLISLPRATGPRPTARTVRRCSKSAGVKSFTNRFRPIVSAIRTHVALYS
jgi:hypothetical protein